MPINIFKKKEKEEKLVEPAEEKKEPKKEKSVSPETSARLPKKKERILSSGLIVLKSVHITEKASDLIKKNQYVFKVLPQANKAEVKKSVENLYGVDVVSVKIINVPRKARRMGRYTGWRKGYKKAIIKIKEGQKIEVLAR